MDLPVRPVDPMLDLTLARELTARLHGVLPAVERPIDPERRFGRPIVEGISTVVLWEHHEAGESVEDIAESFDLAAEMVGWALRFEESSRRRAA